MASDDGWMVSYITLNSRRRLLSLSQEFPEISNLTDDIEDVHSPARDSSTELSARADTPMLDGARVGDNHVTPVTLSESDAKSIDGGQKISQSRRMEIYGAWISSLVQKFVIHLWKDKRMSLSRRNEIYGAWVLNTLRNFVVHLRKSRNMTKMRSMEIYGAWITKSIIPNFVIHIWGIKRMSDSRRNEIYGGWITSIVRSFMTQISIRSTCYSCDQSEHIFMDNPTLYNSNRKYNVAWNILEATPCSDC